MLTFPCSVSWHLQLERTGDVTDLYLKLWRAGAYQSPHYAMEHCSSLSIEPPPPPKPQMLPRKRDFEDHNGDGVGITYRG